MNHQYRKKPVVIDAFQMTEETVKFTNRWPLWLLTAYTKPNNSEGSMFMDRGGNLSIQTLEGNHKVSWGDYIIQGIQGELYACKPDIFVATYDKVIEEEVAA